MSATVPTRRRPRVIRPRARLLRDVREGRGISLTELANATGIAAPYLSQIETGRTVPTSREQHLIAAALGLPAWRVTVRAYLVVEDTA